MARTRAEVLEKKRERYQRNRERLCQEAREYRRKFPDKIRAAKQKSANARRDAVFAAYGNECACCGEDDRRVLCIDHIVPFSNGNGKKKHRGGVHLYAHLMREGFPPGFQTLCANCNMAKGTSARCPLTHGDRPGDA
jgi:hypothetical protein